MHLGLSIFLMFLLIMLNAVLSGAESAIIAVNDLMIDELVLKGDKKAKRIQKFIQTPTRFFSTTQIGMTFMAFINGMIAADALTEPLINLITSGDYTWSGWYIIIQILITLVLTFFQVVFGELVPKKIAIKYPKRFLYMTINGVNLLYNFTRPFVWLFTKTANGFTRLLGIKDGDHDKQMTEEEIRMLVKAGGNRGVIEQDESEMITNVLDFSDTCVEDIMIHRMDMSAISINATKEEVIRFAVEEQYSRIPVYANSIDQVVGILHLKDLFKIIADPKAQFNLKSLIKKPFFVPDTQLINDTFAQMKQLKVHIAIVLDEYGGTAGMITIEDLLEEIVGNIFDEHDLEDDEETMYKVDEHTYIIDGLMNIKDVEETLNAGLPTENYTTLSGFILGELGYYPKEEDLINFSFNDYSFEVISFDGDIIGKVKVTLPVKEENQDV